MPIANVALTDTFAQWVGKTNQIIVQGDQTLFMANSAWIKANGTSNGINAYTVTVGAASNAWTNTVSSQDKAFANGTANSANAYAVSYSISVGSASNSWVNTSISTLRAFANGTANSANAYAVTVGAAANAASDTKDTAGNNYAIQIGAASNTWANSVVSGVTYPFANGTANSANAYAVTVGAAANAASDAKDTAGNNFTISIGASSNAWANTVSNALYPYSNNTANSSNVYAQSIGQAGNNYTVSVGAASNNYSNSTFLKLAGGQTVTGGFSVTSFNAGSNVAAYGTWTPNGANGNYQYVTSNGAVTIEAPETDTAIDVMWTNGINAKTVTFTGSWTAVSGGGGDVYATTNANKYLLMIRRINSISTYSWKALQ